MSFLAVPGSCPVIDYSGQDMELLAGHGHQHGVGGGGPAGFAVARLTIPPRFVGPVPHAHDSFDEGIYVLSGRLTVLAGTEELIAEQGSMLVAPRGDRHGFANPFDEPAEVLNFWSPGALGVAFMTERAQVVNADLPPDPSELAQFYARHQSRLLP